MPYLNEIVQDVSKLDLTKRIPSINLDIAKTNFTKPFTTPERDKVKTFVKKLIEPVVSYFNYYGSNLYIVNLTLVGVSTDFETYKQAMINFEEYFTGTEPYETKSGFMFISMPRMKNYSVRDAKIHYPAKRIDEGVQGFLKSKENNKA